VVRTREEEENEGDKIDSFNKHEQSPTFNKREPEARTGDPEPPININEDLTVLMEHNGTTWPIHADKSFRTSTRLLL
jgi:hypothetical protein